MNRLHSTLASILNGNAALPDVPPWLLDGSSSTRTAAGDPGPGDDDDDDDDDVDVGSIDPDEDEGYDDEDVDDDDEEEPLRCAGPAGAAAHPAFDVAIRTLRCSIP